jgi:hypothetical protein
MRATGLPFYIAKANTLIVIAGLGPHMCRELGSTAREGAAPPRERLLQRDVCSSPQSSSSRSDHVQKPHGVHLASHVACRTLPRMLLRRMLPRMLLRRMLPRMLPRTTVGVLSPTQPSPAQPSPAQPSPTQPTQSSQVHPSQTIHFLHLARAARPNPACLPCT